MSEYINNSGQRKALLKHMLLELHKGEAPAAIEERVKSLLKQIPYNEVVEVEQELIAEGLPEQEILKFCDIHSSVLEGSITGTQIDVPEGHPVDTFKKENREIEKVIAAIKTLFVRLQILKSMPDDKDFINGLVIDLKRQFNAISDVDKHYKRKEYLLFPFLEKAGITGPPKVMWGKHDEIRDLLKGVHESLVPGGDISGSDLASLEELLLRPAVNQIESMIMKEEEILLPMCMETLSEEQWFQIYNETGIYGYCLFDPRVEWKPDLSAAAQKSSSDDTKANGMSYTDGAPVRLSSGSFDIKELEALFVTLPIDITYVDANDKVKFFSHSPNRVFERNRSIIGRDVRLCHPPGSVHIVEQILEDFKAGKEHQAKFWMSNFMGRFIYIEYTALRGKDGEYLGVIEVTQDISEFRKLEGDQRLLSYTKQ
jgi:uncharacterized protein